MGDAQNYPKMVQDKPSCKEWTVNSITSTGDKGPVHLPLYRLPYAYRESIKMSMGLLIHPLVSGVLQ